MAQPADDEALAEALAWVEELQTENAEYDRQLFIARSMIQELSQALSNSQIAQAKANALIKLAQQPTA